MVCARADRGADCCVLSDLFGVQPIFFLCGRFPSLGRQDHPNLAGRNVALGYCPQTCTMASSASCSVAITSTSLCSGSPGPASSKRRYRRAAACDLRLDVPCCPVHVQRCWLQIGGCAVADLGMCCDQIGGLCCDRIGDCRPVRPLGVLLPQPLLLRRRRPPHPDAPELRTDLRRLHRPQPAAGYRWLGLGRLSPFWGGFLQLHPHPARAVRYALLSAPAYRMLMDACNLAIRWVCHACLVLCARFASSGPSNPLFNVTATVAPAAAPAAGAWAGECPGGFFDTRAPTQPYTGPSTTAAGILGSGFAFDRFCSQLSAIMPAHPRCTPPRPIVASIFWVLDARLDPTRAAAAADMCTQVWSNPQPIK